MPLTPYHWGPSSWIGLLFSKTFDLPMLLISSVIIDIEPFVVLLFNLTYPLHGFLHTVLGSSIIASLLVLQFYFLQPYLRRKINYTLSLKKMAVSLYFGVYCHILLDSFLFTDIYPFYPLVYNPLMGKINAHVIYAFCLISFAIGLLIVTVKFLIAKFKKS